MLDLGQWLKPDELRRITAIDRQMSEMNEGIERLSVERRRIRKRAAMRAVRAKEKCQ